MKCWGIDPGLNGALALYDSDNHSIEVFDMPTLEVGKKQKRQIAAVLICDILMNDSNCPVIVERVSAMPGQGVTSMFNFGMGYGIILGILASYQCRHEIVSPVTWRKNLKVGPGKDGSRAEAVRLFPAQSEKFSRKKDDGRADASLLAYWGYKFGFKDGL
tara:strand:- start:832 stop:1311 length:480 start_codon:yes stop_codon:yes gene_type:complete